MWRKASIPGLVLASLATSGAAVDLHVERLGSEHGLAHNAVHAILEDREGFLWFGTQDGLQRYDGVDFETFRADGSDRALSHSHVTELFEAPDGALWIGTASGLDVLSPDRRTLTGAPQAPTGESLAVSRIALAPSGEITVSTRGQGLLAAARSGAELRLRTLLAEPAQIEDHAWTADGRILILGHFDERLAEALVEADGTVVERRALPASGVTGTLAEAAAFGGPTLTSAALGRGFFSDGRQWLLRTSRLVESRGVLLGSFWGLHAQAPSDASARPIALVGVEPGLGTEVLDLARDRSGTLWIGTYGGLLKADPARRAFESLPVGEADPPGAVSSIVPTPGGESILVGTFGGGVQEISLADGRVTRRILPARSGGACSDYVWSAAETARGMMVIATNTAVCALTASGALAAVFGNGSFRALEPDGAGRLWAGGPAGLLRLAPDDLSAEDFGRPSETVRVVSETEVWLGPVLFDDAPPNAVVARLDPSTGAVREYPLARQTSVYDLAPVGDGVLIATSDGLLRLEPQSGEVALLLSAASVGIVYSVQPDAADDRLWLGTSRGLARVELTGESATARVFGIEDGVGNREFNRRARWRADDGRILLGGMAGITAFRPPEIAANPYAPPTRIKRVEVEGRQGRRPLAAGPEARLLPSDFAIDFEFAALNFTRAERNRYRYRLRGVDPDWVEAGRRRAARYAGLAPGAYTFEVVGSNNDGLWGREPASFAFEVLPPWHQTWWARLLALAAAVALLAWLYRVRLARAREIERMRLRIAGDLHDELGSELSGIALASSLVGRSEALADEERRRLTDVEASSRRVMEGLREIVWYVNPEHDSFDSLLDRMRDTARRLSGEIEVTFAGGELPRARRLDMEARRQLFLVFKELLTNAVRHAGATRVAARLASDGQRLELTVTDDGVGLREPAATDGSGLANVRRRAAHLGGSFALEPGAEGGTVARLTVPLT